MGTNNKKQMAGLFRGLNFFSSPRGDIHPCPPSPYATGNRQMAAQMTILSMR